jgi:hypothetical protein
VQRWGSKEISKAGHGVTDLHALRTEIQAVATAPKEGPTFSQGYGGKAPPPPAPPRSPSNAAALGSIRPCFGRMPVEVRCTVFPCAE